MAFTSVFLGLDKVKRQVIQLSREEAVQLIELLAKQLNDGGSVYETWAEPIQGEESTGVGRVSIFIPKSSK